MRLSLLNAMLLIFLLVWVQFAQATAAMSARGGWEGGDDGALELSCDVNPMEVRRGETITWNVTVCNPTSKPMMGVFLEVDFDSDVEPVTASTKPSEARIWRFEEMGGGDCANLTLVVRVPKSQRSFMMSRSISGEGFVSLSEEYSTKEEPYEIGCDISAWAGGMNEPVRNSTVVAVIGEAGTEVSIRERGSGNYSSQEEVRFDKGNGLIEVARNVSAAHRPFDLSYGKNRSANCTSLWSEMIDVRNWLAGNFTNQSQRNATVLDHWSYMKLDENSTVLVTGERQRPSVLRDADIFRQL